MKTFWTDTETTGLSSTRNEIWQLAFLIEIDGKVVVEKNYKMRPLRPETAHPRALEVGKVTLEELAKLPHPAEVYKEMMTVLDRYVDKFNPADKFFFAGQNVQFDVGFLRAFFKQNGNSYFGSYFESAPIDLMTLVATCTRQGLIKTANFKLGTVCDFLGIELKAHDALEDIKATRQAYVTLTDRFMKVPTPVGK